MKKELNETEYHKKNQELFKKWQEKYKEEERGISYDGISDFTVWEKMPVKILFLLKETNNDFEPSVPNQSIYGICGWNIARWTFAINELFKNPDVMPKFPERSDLPTGLSELGIAMVEVKKIHGNSSCPNSIIEFYAKNDSDLLRNQIDLINPQVIICCGTNKSYEIIYEWKTITIFILRMVMTVHSGFMRTD
jgi:hypothetical protein